MISTSYSTNSNLNSNKAFFFYGRTLHLDIIKVFAPTDAQVS
jgi:hypothetical protein